ncbi:MAG: GNAT family N-acetyltransferase [Gemmatimonadetes bacterium]|nr:GNAT family N-acetyltransferase [Gemmatimonadota bacterium]
MSTAGLVWRLAGATDVPAVAALLADAGSALARQGFANWAEPYPAQRLLADLTERQVVGGWQDGALRACFLLGGTPQVPYADLQWPAGPVPAAYLNRMAVAPHHQGRGLGAECLTEVHRRAAALGAQVVRCDVLAANARLGRFYARHGYRLAGRRSHSGWEFSSLERRLGEDHG